MTFEGLGEMIEGYSADTGAGKFPLVLMGVRAEGLACADPGARTPIGASGISLSFSLYFSAITVLPERVVVGFPNFAWPSNYQKY